MKSTTNEFAFLKAKKTFQLSLTELPAGIYLVAINSGWEIVYGEGGEGIIVMQ